MTDEQAVLTERRDGVLVITINRPASRNAVNGEVANGIASALEQLDDDASLAVGMVTGAGDFFRRHGPQGLRCRGSSLGR